MSIASKVHVPEDGQMIGVNADGTLQTPDNPIIPFIRGDGIGADITPVMRFFDSFCPLLQITH